MNYQFYNIRLTIRFLNIKNDSKIDIWNIVKRDIYIRILSISNKLSNAIHYI